MRLEPRTPGLRVKHLTSEPRGTPCIEQAFWLVIGNIVPTLLLHIVWWVQKEKLRVTSDFSFSHNVFKSRLLFMCLNNYLWSKGLYRHCLAVIVIHVPIIRYPQNYNGWKKITAFWLVQNVDMIMLSEKAHWLFTTQSRLLMTLKEKAFENTVGKGGNAGNQHFLHFLQCFLPYQREIIFSATIILSSANAFNLDQSKVLPFGKE